MGFTFWMWVAAVALLAGATAMAWQGRRMSRVYRAFDRTAQQAQGVVLSVEWLTSQAERTAGNQSVDNHAMGAAFPVVEYHLPDGRLIRARTYTGRKPAPAKKGQQVAILYDPNDPQYIELAHGSGRGMMAPLYYVLAASFAGFAALVVLVWWLLKVVMKIPI